MRSLRLFLPLLLLVAAAGLSACMEDGAPGTPVGPPAAPSLSTDSTSSPTDTTVTTTDGGGFIGGGS